MKSKTTKGKHAKPPSKGAVKPKHLETMKDAQELSDSHLDKIAGGLLISVTPPISTAISDVGLKPLSQPLLDSSSLKLRR